MGSLVEELQRDALDGRVDIRELLRKAYVVATKLNLVEFKEWTDCELNGYRGREVPNYRRTVGQVVILNPQTGRVAVMRFEDPKMAKIVSEHHEQCPVGPLLELLASSSGSVLIADFPPEMQNLLMKPFGQLPGIPHLQIGRSVIHVILDAVRNTILEWSLKLEAAGILGADLSFSKAEQAAASQKIDTLRPTTNITVGHMENSTIQQSSPGGSTTS